MEIPDEGFFQTIAYATRWRDHSVWEPARFPMPMRQEHWDLENCGTGPCLLTEEDLNIVLNGGRVDSEETRVDKFEYSAVNLFARKFDPKSDTMYNFVDNVLYKSVIFGPRQPLVTLDDTWWRE